MVALLKCLAMKKLVWIRLNLNPIDQTVAYRYRVIESVLLRGYSEKKIIKLTLYFHIFLRWRPVEKLIMGAPPKRQITQRENFPSTSLRSGK